MKWTTAEHEPTNITGDKNVYQYSVSPSLLLEYFLDRYNAKDFSIRTVWSFLDKEQEIKEQQTYNCLILHNDTLEEVYSDVDRIIEDSIERVAKKYNVQIKSSDYKDYINQFKKLLPFGNR